MFCIARNLRLASYSSNACEVQCEDGRFKWPAQHPLSRKREGREKDEALHMDDRRTPTISRFDIRDIADPSEV